LVDSEKTLKDAVDGEYLKAAHPQRLPPTRVRREEVPQRLRRIQTGIGL
jgi:hypothetical protein